MFRLLYIYNDLQDNILTTQNLLNSLYRRQARIETYIYRLAQLDRLQDNYMANTNTTETNNNSSPINIPDPPNSPTANPNNNNNNNEHTMPRNEDDPPYLSEPPFTPNTPSQSPINNVFSNIFNHIPNFLPSQTMASLNPNYHQNNNNNNNSEYYSSRYSNIRDPSNSNFSDTLHYLTRPSQPPPHRLSSYTGGELFNQNQNTILYNPRRSDEPLEWRTLNTQNNTSSEFVTPRHLVETLLFAIMETSPNSSEYNNSEQPFTSVEIDTCIKKCQFNEIIDPLNITCPITMDAFQPNTQVMQLIYCGHIFTESELRTWLITKRICPICRHTINQSN